MKKFIALIIILALAFGFCGGRFYENKRMEKYKTESESFE